MLGFPCNQFGYQDASSNEEIAGFCSLNYGVDFPMIRSTSTARPSCSGLARGASSWPARQQGREVEFHQVPIGRNGLEVIERFVSQTPPEKLTADIDTCSCPHWPRQPDLLHCQGTACATVYRGDPLALLLAVLGCACALGDGNRFCICVRLSWYRGLHRLFNVC